MRAWVAWVATALVATGNSYLSAQPRDGVPDPAFGTNGMVSLLATADALQQIRRVYDVVVDPDGRIVLAVQVSNGSASHSGLVALNRDGTFDMDFGAGGYALVPEEEVQLTSLFGNHEPRVARTTGGRYVYASIKRRVGLARSGACTQVVAFDAQGTLDPSYAPFGASECSDFGYPMADNEIRWWQESLTPTPDGGVFLVAPASLTTAPGSTAYLKLTSAGQLDTQFAGTGILFGDNVQRGTVQSDGNFLIGANSIAPAGDAAAGVSRLLSAGGVDPDFGAAGHASANFAAGRDFVQSIVQDGEGRILVGGTQVLEDPIDCTFCVARLLPGGSPDLSFNGMGQLRGGPGVAKLFDQYDGSFAEEIVTRGSQIVLAGSFAEVTPGPRSLGAVALTEDGALDARFGSAASPGVIRIPIPGEPKQTGEVAAAVDFAGRLIMTADALGVGSSPVVVVVALIDDGLFSDQFETGD